VPYNPYLIRRYKAHINVEICITVQAVKYIHKYIYKGRDRATLKIADTDEIRRYVTCRYISLSQAIWSLLEFLMHKEHPIIIRLPLHLPYEQPVRFGRSDSEQELQQRMKTAYSTFISFFDYNRDHENERYLLYH
jgi:hypothetical protein